MKLNRRKIESYGILKGKVAIITGGTKGIGRSIAVRFAMEGASVSICARRQEEGHQLIEEINKLGGKCIFVKADMSKEADIRNLAEKTIEAFGKLDILVNNAAIGLYKTCETLTEEEWYKSFDTNVKGYWLSCKNALPYLKKSGKASIINLSSVHAYTTSPSCMPYALTKGSITSLTRCLAVDYGKYGIRANTILPGLIYTESTGKDFDMPVRGEKLYKKVLVNECLGRMGMPEDVAGAAVFLASDDAAFVTGSELYVDGGASARLYGNVYEELEREESLK